MDPSIVTPETLDAIARFGDHGQRWLSDLPRTLERLEAAWSIRIGPRLPHSTCSFVATADLECGAGAILKVPIPHEEAEHEADALRIWDGDGAVALIGFDDDSGAMLVELAQPGTPLAESVSTDEAARIGGELVGRLHRTPPDGHDVASLAEVCARWAGLARDRVRRAGTDADRTLVDEGADLLERLPREAERAVVLHGDYHHWNVLASEREPWLAIDPKPMVGDPVFDAAQFLRNHYELANDAAEFERGIGVFADASGFDGDRMLAWAFAKSVEDAMWDLSHSDVDGAKRWIDYARRVRVLRGT